MIKDNKDGTFSIVRPKVWDDEPVAWINNHMDEGWLSWDKDSTADSSIPLYAHSYKRPINSVLVPCDKLAEMQAELAILRKASEK